MLTFNPHLLPKVRSEAIMRSAQGQPCSLRVASFVGKPCAGIDTVVCAHIPGIGKGMGTKVSDLFVAYACQRCHDIVDGRDAGAFKLILDRYSAAFGERLRLAMMETQSRMLGAEIIVVPDGRLV